MSKSNFPPFLETSSSTIIGMIHVQALPGTPLNQFSPKQILDQAVNEAIIYRESGIDVLAIENMHDIPYLKRNIGPEIVALMTLMGHEIKRVTSLPCGIQILAGANQEAVAAAHAAGLDFVRAEGFVFAHVADEGIIESDAGDLLRYRKQIGAESVAIFTDIKKKHSSHQLTMDVDIVETAHAAEYFLSDGLIVTGKSTGLEADLEEIQRVKEAVDIPVLVGSGITIDNVGEYLKVCDGLIVGSWFKEKGDWKRPVSGERVRRFMEKVKK